MRQVAVLNGVALHYRHIPGTGTPLVFLNSLGTDFRIWDAVIDGLALGAPILCLDTRGHGLSDEGAISMGALVGDVAGLMDHLALPPGLICGVSVGGMVAQGLALARPDLVAGLVLCCTGARIGEADNWTDRIAAVTAHGILPLADAILARWFSPEFGQRRGPDLAACRNMLIRTPVAGYLGVCEAIRDTDFTDRCARIDRPTHCIAGLDDLATPSAMVRRLAGLIPGATYQEIPGCGHLPCLEAPGAVRAALTRMHGALA